MRYGRNLAALLALVRMLSLTAYGGAPTAAGAAPESAVYYNEEYGLVIQQWTQPYQKADARLVQTFALASGYGDFNVYHLLMCEFFRTDDTEEPCIAAFGDVIFSTNPDGLKENADVVAAVNEYRAACGEEPIDDTFEKITTANGRTLWLRQFPEQPVILQGEPTQEEEAAIAAMYQGFADQIAQIELVEAKPVAATGRVSFTTVDLNGSPADSSVFANAELTLVNIWGSYCPYSIGEMEDLMKLDAEMENLQVITILGDSSDIADEAAEDAREVVEELNLTFPVYIMTDEIMEIFPYEAFPTSFLVDRNGNPVGVAFVGDATAETFSEWILSSTQMQRG